ncbi:MAG TPA: SDR family NAD(P)-dependent oxidoreductase [Terriglobales bacterium]
MQMTGNTIFITGGGSGIGRGLAEALHKLANKVIIGGRRREVLADTAAANSGMEYVVLDTMNAESIRAAAKEATSRWPKLNVVINNAGVQRTVNFAEAPVDEHRFEQEIDTNIYGVLRVTNAFLPHLKQQPSATLINISSGLAFMPLAQFPVYCATKAFVHSFTMSLRYQLRGTSVRVVELAPPWVKTELDAQHQEAVPSGSNFGPMPLPEFIAAAMQELASDSDELTVAGAKFLYSAGVSERAKDVFTQMNSR